MRYAPKSDSANPTHPRFWVVLFLGMVLLIVTSAGSASFTRQDLKHNFKYECNGETIVVGHCRSDDDGPGMPRTQPSADYCMVYFPSRPKRGGFTVQETELRSDVVRQLTACNALTAPTPTSAPAPAPVTGAEALNAQGDKHLDAREYDKAIEVYKKALAIDPKYAASYAGLGIAYFQINRWQLSLEAFQKYQSLTKAHPAFLVIMGNDHRILKHYDEALKVFRGIISEQPEKRFELNAYYGIGETYSDMREFHNALSAYESALRIDPDDTNTLREIGNTYYSLGQYPKALAAVQQSIKLQPKNAAAIRLLGFIYVKMGKREQALEAYRTLLTLDKEMAAELYAKINQ